MDNDSVCENDDYIDGKLITKRQQGKKTKISYCINTVN